MPPRPRTRKNTTPPPLPDELAGQTSAELDHLSPVDQADFDAIEPAEERVMAFDGTNTPPMGDLLAELAELGRSQDPNNPTAIFTGTFALYPEPTGGLVLVAEATTGPSGPGVYRIHAKRGMLRALFAVLGGAGRVGGGFKGAMQALRGR